MTAVPNQAQGAAAGGGVATGLVADVQGRRAGFVTRGIGFTIDFFCVLAAFPLVMWAIGLAVGLLNFSRPEYPELAAAMATAIQLAIMFLYFVGPWSITGRTLGQGLLGLRVVGRRTRRVNPLQATVRWFVLFATLFVIGPVWLALSGKRLALHDRASRTQVIYDRAPRRARLRVDDPPAPATSHARAAGTASDGGGSPAGTMVVPEKEPSDA